MLSIAIFFSLLFFLCLSGTQAFKFHRPRWSLSSIHVMLDSMELDSLISTTSVETLAATLGDSLSINLTCNDYGHSPSVDQIVSSIKASSTCNSSVDVHGVIKSLLAKKLITSEDSITNRMKVAIVLIGLLKRQRSTHQHQTERTAQQAVGVVDRWAS